MMQGTDLIAIRDTAGVPVKNLARTPGGLIVNTDRQARALYEAQAAKIQNTDTEINSLKGRLDRIEGLLAQLVEKL